MTHDELVEQLSKDWNGTPVLFQALRAVVELHNPVLWQGIEMVCDGCGMNIEQNYNSEYPCETIQAIEKELT